MIRISNTPLLKGHPFTDKHTLKIEETSRVDVGIYELHSQTHLLCEAICQPEDEPHYRELLRNHLKITSQHWERHYAAVSAALSI